MPVRESVTGLRIPDKKKPSMRLVPKRVDGFLVFIQQSLLFEHSLFSCVSCKEARQRCRVK